MSQQVDLSACKVVVYVFAMDGCPACEHYLPRFTAEAQMLNEQFQREGQHTRFWINPEVSPPAGVIPVFVYDAASPDANVQALADQFGVQATPTTVIAVRGPGSFKCEGSLANNQIRWILLMASEANR